VLDEEGAPPEAEGWMQFLPSSWEAFGVDGNGDGAKDPYNPWDAIFAAAHLLRYSGAPGNWHDAIYSYNHAGWYVEDVLAGAEKWAAIGSAEAVASCESAAPNERVAQVIVEADRLSAMRPETEYVWAARTASRPRREMARSTAHLRSPISCRSVGSTTRR
jgi:hypothetical protein